MVNKTKVFKQEKKSTKYMLNRNFSNQGTLVCVSQFMFINNCESV